MNHTKGHQRLDFFATLLVRRQSHGARTDLDRHALFRFMLVN